LVSPWKFARHGDSGLPVSELFPHIASCADDLAVIRSMKADLPLHSTGVLFLHTGANNAGRPIDNIVPADKDARVQRAKLDLLRQQDTAFAQALGGDDAVESAIKNYE